MQRQSNDWNVRKSRLKRRKSSDEMHMPNNEMDGKLEEKVKSSKHTKFEITDLPQHKASYYSTTVTHTEGDKGRKEGRN